MANDIIDSLEINISTSSNKMTKGLDELLASLKKLDRFGKRLSQSSGLKELKSQLKGIASIKFDSLASKLKTVSNSVKELEKANNSLRAMSSKSIDMPEIDTTKVTAPMEELVNKIENATEVAREFGEEFNNATSEKPEWLNDIQGTCQSIVDSFETSAESLNTARERLQSSLSGKSEQFSGESVFKNGMSLDYSLDDKFEKLRLQAENLSIKLAELRNSNNEDVSVWNSLEKQLLTVRLQYAALRKQIDKSADSLDELTEKSEKSKGKFEKMFDQLKRVAFYRITRFILSQISKAAREGIANIAAFSEEANAIMSQYKTEAAYVKNSVGAAVIPMLQAIMPLVIRIGDALADIGNSISMVSAAVSGKNTFVRAKKYVQDYANAVDKAKRSTVGFDELNILGQADANTSEMFENVEINGGEVAGAIAKLTGLVAAITTLVIMLKGAKIKEFFGKISTGASKVLNVMKNMTTGQKVAASLAALATEAVVCYNGFYDMFTGARSVGSVLLELIPICGAVGVAMYAMWGPVGVVIGAVVGVVSALAGAMKALDTARREAVKDQFYNTASENAIKLDELSSAFANVWDKTRNFATVTSEANDAINESAEKIDSLKTKIDLYLSKLDETGTLTGEEASAISTSVTEMVNELDTQLDTRMKSILDAFSNMSKTANANFLDDLGEMKTAFLEFQTLMGKTTSSYKVTIDTLLEKSTTEGLTNEEVEKLNKAVDNLSALNVVYSTERFSFDEILEKGRNGDIDFENPEAVKTFFTEFKEKIKTYQDSLKTTLDNSLQFNKQNIMQNERLYSQGAISEDDYNRFKDAFSKAEENLRNSYSSALASMESDITKALDSIQSAALYKTALIGSMAIDSYANATWWQLIGMSSQDEYVYSSKKIGEAKEEILEPLNELIANLINVENLDYSPWMLPQYTDAMRQYNTDRTTTVEYLTDIFTKVPAHADGGFPEDGLFFANSRELVGQFSNGKTAVANNYQIVEGIKQGVSEAMAESSGGQGGDWIIQIVDEDGGIKGEAVITAAERKNRRDGKTIISVGG